MAEILMYLDPSCDESKVQMKNLEKAGNTVECKDLTFYKWSREDLLPFVRGRDPLQIINSQASQVKLGKIDPLLLTFDEALTLMVESPSLIKGPLVQVDNLHIQGKKDQRINKYLARIEKSVSTGQSKLHLIRSRSRAKFVKSTPFLPYFGCSYA